MERVASLPADTQLGRVAERVRRIEALGYDTVHVSETVRDPFTVCALALEHTSRLTVRTSMVVAFARSPMVTAYSAWELARFSGGRFQLGLATQVRGNIVGRFSMPWSDPAAQLRDYLDSLRAIFGSFATGEPLSHSGTHYTFDRLQPYFRPGPVHVPAPQLWTGGVNRRMCVLAGECSDGFVTHPTNSHPTFLREHILPALREGAERRGRRDGGPRVVVVPKAITGRDDRVVAAAREAARSEFAFLYSTPAYRGTLAALGLTEFGERLTRLAREQRWNEMTETVSDEVLRTLVPHGTYAQLPAVLESWYGGTCDGLSIDPPEDPADDDEFAALLDRIRAIPVRPVR